MEILLLIDIINDHLNQERKLDLFTEELFLLCKGNASFFVNEPMVYSLLIWLQSAKHLLKKKLICICHMILTVALHYSC